MKSSLLSRGFAHGFLVPLVGILPVHGLLFAFYRSPLDFVVRGHWGDGVRWLSDFQSGPVAMAVSALAVLFVLLDAGRRWVATWRDPESPRLDLFWTGIVAGCCLYATLRQIGTLTQWQLVGNGFLCGLRMVVFGGIAVFLVTRAIAAAHPGSPWAVRIRWGGAVVVLGSLLVVGKGGDLVTWQVKRVALETGEPEDFQRWLNREEEPAARDCIRKLAWSTIGERCEIGSLVDFEPDSEAWGGFADSLRALTGRCIVARSRSRSSTRFSSRDSVDKIWRDLLRRSGDSSRRVEVQLDLVWERSRIGFYLDSVRRGGGPVIHPDRAMPLYGMEQESVRQAAFGVAASIDPDLLAVGYGKSPDSAKIRVSLEPFLGRDPAGRRPPVGYRWKAILASGPTSDTLEFTSCDTVLGFAPPGECPRGGNYDQDSVHARRQGGIRWNDMGTTPRRLESFLREAWGKKP
ncbi:MAG TPA: hypothetical protein PKY05_15770 [Fibrobacteria bacterium]|nr:hypothetical protein [Fibrobacteria bacterium]